MLIRSYRTLLCALWLLGASAAGPSWADNPPKQPSLTQQLTSLEKTGEAELSWLWFPLYRAELYVAKAPYQPSQWPQALQLNYLRDIEKKHLLTATDKQWKKLGVAEAQRQPWLRELEALWPDVQQGDSITLWVGEDQRSVFYHNQRWLGRVEDPAFSEQFLAIWLDERSEYPEQRRELIGARQP